MASEKEGFPEIFDRRWGKSLHSNSAMGAIANGSYFDILHITYPIK